MMIKSTLLTGLLSLTILFSHAQTQQPQSRAELERQREAIQKEIEDVKRTLDETHRNKKETLGQLALLQRRLHLRESAVANINSQINFIQGDMNESWRQIMKFRRELDTLKEQYAQSIVFSYKNRTSYDFLNFIFSANSFNDALKRIQYLKSYRAYQEERAATIVRTQQQLQGKIDGLKVTRVQKDEALKKQSREMATLEVEKKEKDAVVSRLKSQEKELKKEMAAKVKQDQKLSSAITAVIRRATLAAAKESNAAKANASANKEPTPSNPSTTASRPRSYTVFDKESDIRLTGSFEKNKGHLPWPVSQGTISMSFGVHEYIPGIKYNNTSITIDVEPGAAVKAVFDGVITSVMNIGESSAVMIRHGKYFTIYGNLSTVSVQKDQQVTAGQIIGRVDAGGKLEFKVCDDKVNMFDPERWLHR